MFTLDLNLHIYVFIVHGIAATRKTALLSSICTYNYNIFIVHGIAATGRQHYFLTFALANYIFIVHGIAATGRQHYFLTFALANYIFIVHGIAATGKAALYS